MASFGAIRAEEGAEGGHLTRMLTQIGAGGMIGTSSCLLYEVAADMMN
ncbi:MAG: hypothetical protein IPG99_02755 [Ignavibacteria bacterium]|nr:hypothetical protein [Ignavibacteria bacterium]